MPVIEIDPIPVTTERNPQYGTLTSSRPDIFGTVDNIFTRVAGLGSAWADFELRKHELELAARYQYLEDLNNQSPGEIPPGTVTTTGSTNAGMLNVNQNQLVTFALLAVGLIVAVTSR